jgi:hypothetical protein
MSQDPENLPLERQVPRASVASPADLRPRDPREIRWYQPSWSDTFRLMGWRIVYFAPAVAIVLFLVLLPWRALVFAPLLIASWKLIFIAVAIPTSLALKTARNIIRQRKEPFCIHCGYDLSGLADNHTCPECGEPYTHRAIEEYRRDPHWFIQRYHMHKAIPVVDKPFDALPSKRKRSRDGT